MGLAERRATCRALIRKYYADVPGREEVLDQVVSSLIEPGDVLLDAGCGSTLALMNRYAAQAAYAVGVDVVEVAEKPARNAAVALGDLGAIPVRDGTFDLIVSRSVVEHLDDPIGVFREMARVLKPGGRFVFTTPNRWYYSSLVAAAVPYRVKDMFMKGVFGEDGYDHFPVRYRANTRPAIRRVSAAAGLAVERITALRHYPYYFVFSPTLFRLGMLYDWLVTGLRLDALQSTWVVVLRKA